MNAPSPGWNPDPTGRHEYRYWDGAAWTDDVSDSGVTSVDPVAGAAPGSEPTAPFEPTQQYGTTPGGPSGSPPGGSYGGQPGPGGPGGAQDPSYGGGPGGPGGAQGPGSYGGPGGPGAPQGPGSYGGGYGAPPGPGGYGSYGSGQLPPAQPPKSRPPVGLIVGIAVVALVVIIGLVVALGGGDDDDTATDDTTTTTQASSDDTTGDTTADTTADTTEDTVEAEDSDVFSLDVGDCLAEETADEVVESVPTVPCDQPHTSEIFFSHMIDTENLPGSTEMEQIVEDVCLTEFETFVGLPYPDSALLVTWLEPTEESWEAGDRELLCLINHPDGQVTGTLRNAGY